MVSESQRGHPRGIEYVSTVEDDRLTHQATHHLEVRVAKFIPLGNDSQRISLLECAIGSIAVSDPVAIERANIRDLFGIVDTHVRTGMEQ